MDSYDNIELHSPELMPLDDLEKQGPASLLSNAWCEDDGHGPGERNPGDSLILGSSDFSLGSSLVEGMGCHGSDGESTIGPNSAQRTGDGSTVRSGKSLDQEAASSNDILRPDSPTLGQVASSTPDLGAGSYNETTATQTQDTPRQDSPTLGDPTPTRRECELGRQTSRASPEALRRDSRRTGPYPGVLSGLARRPKVRRGDGRRPAERGIESADTLSTVHDQIAAVEDQQSR